MDVSERLLSFIEASHFRACLVLLFFSLVCFLPGFVSLQPMDRDEPRFAQASKQMLETGDFVDIRFQGEARHKKPVGIYWLQSTSVALGETLGIDKARGNIAFYRIPSLIGALATVLLTYWAVLAFVEKRHAFWAAAFMAASLLLMVEARLAKTDAVLTACSVATMGILARAWLQRKGNGLSTSLVVCFWLAMAMAILVKGPMTPLFVGLCALVLSIFERSGKWLLALRPGLGLLLVVLIASPWFVMIASKTGGDFFAASVGHDMLGKVGGGQEKHWGPPGAYVVVFFATFWPMAILTAIAASFALKNWRDDKVIFLLAWVIPCWLVFEAVPTKLPHYVLPLYPALAILTVLAIAKGEVGPHRPFAKAAALLIPFIPLATMLAIGSAVWVGGGNPPWAAWLLLLLSFALAFHAWISFLRDEIDATAWKAFLSSALLSLSVFGLVLPAFSSLRLSPRLAQAAQECPFVGTLGYREPSLVFLVGTSLEMLDTPEEAALFFRKGGCRMVFVESRFEDRFRQAMGQVEPERRISGFNINGGRTLDIGVYVAK